MNNCHITQEDWKLLRDIIKTGAVPYGNRLASSFHFLSLTEQNKEAVWLPRATAPGSVCYLSLDIIRQQMCIPVSREAFKVE